MTSTVQRLEHDSRSKFSVITSIRFELVSVCTAEFFFAYFRRLLKVSSHRLQSFNRNVKGKRDRMRKGYPFDLLLFINYFISLRVYPVD